MPKTQVPGLQIRNESLTTDDLAPNSVNTTEIVDGAVTTLKIGDLAITRAKLADGALEATVAGRAKMADGFVTALKIAPGAILSGTGISVTGTQVSLASGNTLSLFNLAINGILSRTASGTVTARTLTAQSSRISIINGDGVAGNPTIDVAEGNLALNNIAGTLGIAKGGTGSTTGSITGSGALTFTAGGTNQDITLLSSGSGLVSIPLHGNGIMTIHGKPTPIPSLIVRSNLSSLVTLANFMNENETVEAKTRILVGRGFVTNKAIALQHNFSTEVASLYHEGTAELSGINIASNGHVGFGVAPSTGHRVWVSGRLHTTEPISTPAEVLVKNINIHGERATDITSGTHQIIYFNTVDRQLKLWNGSSLQIIT